MLIPYVEHAFGIYHVLGGLNQISVAMGKVVREEGGEIHTGTPVRRLVLDGRTVKGVELEGGDNVYADDVIINADFAYAMSHFVAPGVLRKYSAENLEKKRYSCSTFMLYLGVDKVYDLPHHNIIFAKDYRSNVDDIFDRMVLSDDLSFYIQNASVTDRSLAPEGKSTLYILVPIPNNKGRIDWDKEEKEFRDRVLDQVGERTSMKDLRDHIKVERIITPANWERDYNIYMGAIFSLAHNWSQLLYFRPRNRYEELEHCYLVGGGTHPGTGLPIIFEGARISANLLCKHYNVSYRSSSALSGKRPIHA
jgi:phytoene desaturase